MYVLMLPYVVLVGVYLKVYKVYSTTPIPPSWASAFWKCLPIWYLLILVITNDKVHEGHAWYKFLVSIALGFSLVGDFCMNWLTTYFIHGLGAFAFAQIAYIAAFNFTTWEWEVGLVVLLMSVPYFTFLVPNIKEYVMKIAVVGYIIIIGLMGWRATALYRSSFKYEALYSVVGAWMFIISDTIIAVNRWIKPFERSFFCIMATYYVAQMCIVLSAIIPGWRASHRLQFVGF